MTFLHATRPALRRTRAAGSRVAEVGRQFVPARTRTPPTAAFPLFGRTDQWDGTQREATSATAWNGGACASEGHQLDGRTNALEPGSDHDFGRIRVHNGHEAAEPAYAEGLFVRAALKRHLGLLNATVRREIQSVESPEETTDPVKKKPPPAKGPAYPTGIDVTKPIGSPLNYGSVYKHQLKSSDGDSMHLAGIVIGEEVKVSRDDFHTGKVGVTLGTVTGPCNKAGQFDDLIETPSADINKKVAAGVALPAIIDTPQTLYWRDGAGAWHEFATVPITFTVHREGGTIKAETVDNGKPLSEPYSGTPSPAPPAPSPAPPSPTP
jgi:hypothetical protein